MEPTIKVMVVDDEEGLADYMCRILRVKGYQGIYETDGIRAVELFIKERPQVLLIDVDLGNSSLDGIDVLEKVKAIDKDAVCVMVTRVTDEESVDKARKLGAFHYVLKPLDSGDVVKVANEAADVILKRRG